MDDLLDPGTNSHHFFYHWKGLEVNGILFLKSHYFRSDSLIFETSQEMVCDHINGINQLRNKLLSYLPIANFMVRDIHSYDLDAELKKLSSYLEP